MMVQTARRHRLERYQYNELYFRTHRGPCQLKPDVPKSPTFWFGEQGLDTVGQSQAVTP